MPRAKGKPSSYYDWINRDISEQQLSISKVGQQPVSSATTKHTGGADQILLPRDFPASWVKSVQDGKTGKGYTYEQFEKVFPNQIKRQSRVIGYEKF